MKSPRPGGVRSTNLQPRRCGAMAAVGCAAIAAAVGCRPAPKPPPSIVLISVDTLRADRVGHAGDRGPLTPELDRAGERGVVFTHASTPAPFTMPAVAALMTGRYPDRTGVRSHGPRDHLSEGVPTLASLVKGVGYETMAVLTNPWLAREATGFGRSFDRVASGRDTGARTRMDAAAVTDRALAFIDRTRRPFLLWAHYMDTHMPYRPPAFHGAALGAPAEGTSITTRFGEPHNDRQRLYFAEAVDPDEAEATRRLYDACVHYVDAEIGRLLAGLQARSLLENSVIIITADHGEALGEHGLHFAHDFNVYEELLRVPLIVLAPGLEPMRRADAVSLVDVLPTLCRLAHLDCPAALDGVALLPVSEQPDSPRAVFAASAPRRARYGRSPWTPVSGLEGRLTTARIGRLKLIRTPLPLGGARWELYDLIADPAERENLYGRTRHEPLLEALVRWEERMRADSPVAARDSSPLDRRTRNELRELGYID